jgi:hypothetical protein
VTEEAELLCKKATIYSFVPVYIKTDNEVHIEVQSAYHDPRVAVSVIRPTNKTAKSPSKSERQVRTYQNR